MPNTIQSLKNDLLIAAVKGKFKTYRTIKKQLATVAVNDFGAFKNTKSMEINKVPLFSRVGLKMLKVKFLNLFTPKTPEEKLLKNKILLDKLDKERKQLFKDVFKKNIPDHKATAEEFKQKEKLYERIQAKVEKLTNKVNQK